MSTPAHLIPLHDAARLRRLETQAIARLGGDAYGLMEAAGEAGWRELLRHWPQAQRIVVACGPGNNGGDGYVLARHAHAAGRDVRVLRLDGHVPRSEPARRAEEAFAAARGQVDVFAGELPDADVLVDALFGIGFARAPDAATTALILAINGSGLPVLSLDMPSGVDCDSGHVSGTAIHATRTLEFMGRHAGSRTGRALDHAGELSLATLDLPAAAFDGVDPVATLLQPGALAHFLHPRPRDTHKGANGHVLCIGGDAGMAGAIALCAEAALRVGAGLASVATREAHAQALPARLPECMAHGVASAHQLQALLERADVVALGPGLGQGDWSHALHAAALASPRPLVVDADALTLLAAEPRKLHGAILTPHPGEAARLLDGTVADVQRDRFAAAARLALQFDAVVVLKGAGTVVAAPGVVPCVIGAGNPGMAVGGMGDVLTGVIAGLRAQDMPPFDAACCGALLHAAAGDLAAAQGGERGLLPSDLFPFLRTLANPCR